MAASSLRKSKRRAMSDINVVPYIDVMLVLLVIFMVTAPMVNPGVVNLPTVGGAKVQPYPPIFLTINADEKITIQKEGEPAQNLNKFEVGAFARSQAEKSADQPIMIAGDRDIKYGVVMDVMSTLKENGVKRISLAVKTQ
ncbi:MULTISPECIES: protein TolR [unclassified Polynucleobacter]|jgi:biopolymer transport protein TolR|uniref:protein TolR n=1 Tax=unclassified Polynucleobacter TaxID=2640945 RepID=UPI001BFECEA9|nr:MULTISPECIES: protein TolR [unclassified Polynucleobacter]MBU3606097.1 protein TolR [Polynucleobacter sp. MWH-Creno-3A4]QWD78242.1 protein TolR [Polynucleobacter sp. MWH-Svant-W18]